MRPHRLLARRKPGHNTDGTYSTPVPQKIPPPGDRQPAGRGLRFAALRCRAVQLPGLRQRRLVLRTESHQRRTAAAAATRRSGRRGRGPAARHGEGHRERRSRPGRAQRRLQPPRLGTAGQAHQGTARRDSALLRGHLRRTPAPGHGRPHPAGRVADLRFRPRLALRGKERNHHPGRRRGAAPGQHASRSQRSQPAPAGEPRRAERQRAPARQGLPGGRRPRPDAAGQRRGEGRQRRIRDAHRQGARQRRVRQASGRRDHSPEERHLHPLRAGQEHLGAARQQHQARPEHRLRHRAQRDPAGEGRTGVLHPVHVLPDRQPPHVRLPAAELRLVWQDRRLSGSRPTTSTWRPTTTPRSIHATWPPAA